MSSKSKVPIPLWLDCDPGHDDAFAILMAARHPLIKLLGVSTVFGNAPLEKTSANASSMLTAISRRDVTVYPGANKALVRAAIHAPAIHGESGIDGTDLLPRPLTPINRAVSAIDAIAAAIMAEDEGTAWIVATGALTNVAQLFRKHPELVHHVKGLSIMGGAVGGGFTDAVLGKVGGVERFGNWTPFAEFNIVIDAEAAESIFRNEELAAKTTLIPLDVTHLVLSTKEVQHLLLYGKDGEVLGKGKTKLRIMLVDLLHFFADTYRDVFGILPGPPLHDPLAVAAVLGDSEVAFYDYVPDANGTGAPTSAPASMPPPPPPSRRERYSVHIVTDGTHEEAVAGDAQTGRTVITLLPPGQDGVRIPRGLDIERFWTVLEECVRRADEENAKTGMLQ